MVDRRNALRALLPQVKELVSRARRSAAYSVNRLQVYTNFEIGRLIVVQEQRGDRRAKYGKKLLRELAESLTREFGKGFSHRNLEYMRRFFLVYQDRAKAISQTVSAISETDESGEIPSTLFTLSWSHYVFLIQIPRFEERHFYEIEASSLGWSLRELRRQFDSSLFERLALSGGADMAHRLGRDGQKVEVSKDLLKTPLVLEFLGLEDRSNFSENDFESAIIQRLERFLLELGKGFLFEARQKRFSFAEEHFFVDLVFYNRLLHCYVLVDLKIGKLTHQDLGQMQMYVNYFDRCVKRAEEKPTVGIILCKKKHDALVELTLPQNAAVYASEYQLYLPSKETLRQKLMDWAGEAEEEIP